MLPKTVLKYVLDIESVIGEIEQILSLHENDYIKFSSSFISVRAAERDLMIIGEAVNKLTRLAPDINISSSKHIIGLRNMIVHAYDSIDPTTLWRIMVKDIPLLKQEIIDIKN